MNYIGRTFTITHFHKIINKNIDNLNIFYNFNKEYILSLQEDQLKDLFSKGQILVDFIVFVKNNIIFVGNKVSLFSSIRIKEQNSCECECYNVTNCFDTESLQEEIETINNKLDEYGFVY